MAAGTLVGTRSALLWAGIGLTNIAVFLVLEQHGITHTSLATAASERLLLAFGLASVNILVLLLTQLYESYKNTAFSVLQLARVETEAARLKAEEASRAKSQFLANMSHEIRTPLNAVLGMTSLLLDTRLDGIQQDYVETAHASGEHLLTVINDILDFSKIEAGRLDLDHAPFAVRDVVDESLDVVALGAGKKELEISALVEPDVPDSVEGDSGRLRQVLVNLLSNAIKFTDRGEVTLTVAARALDARGNFEITFTVRDTGIGIAPEHRDLLFAVFTQVDASSTRRHGGTGLGLAISKRLVEMMGGRIWLESAPDRGSTFAFTIRALRSTPVTDRIDGGAREKLAGRRVLIVDDNATNRRILSAFTASWGMAPRDTASPTESLRWLASGEPFDVAILDFQMPEMDGAELARRIRELPGHGAFPIVLATSSLGRSARETAEAAPGFTAYLVKPVRRAHLIALLARVLASAPVATTTPAPEIEIDHGSSPAPAPPPEPSPVAEAPGDDTLVPLRVLLVEDNKMNQKVALAMLSRLGLVADLAGDGSQAIAAIAAKRYDVVLMDVQMPVMDGLTAARAICHRWSAAERPRMIAMTANAMTGDEQRCKEAGMDDYVSKPVKLEELAAALRRNGQRA